MIHCFWWHNDWIIINIFVFLSHLNRVLNPPGGRSSNIFGGGYEQEAAPVNRNKMTNNVLNDNSNINGNQIDPPVNHSRCNPDRHKSNDIFGDGQSNQAANKPRRGLYLFFTWIKSTFFNFLIIFFERLQPNHRQVVRGRANWPRKIRSSARTSPTATGRRSSTQAKQPARDERATCQQLSLVNKDSPAARRQIHSIVVEGTRFLEKTRA